MSKHEPIYQCCKCKQYFSTEEISEHTEFHIELGIFRSLNKN